jgi:hypothetical protein
VGGIGRGGLRQEFAHRVGGLLGQLFRQHQAGGGCAGGWASRAYAS